jgi:hypothetical protein
VWWNTNLEFAEASAAVAVGSGPSRREVKSVDFEPDPKGQSGQSGRFRFGGDAAFDWSPFDPVELVVRVGDKVAVAVRYTSYDAAAGLLERHDLSAVGADPELSGCEVACDVGWGGGEVPPREFLDHVRRVRPRVVPLVPHEDDPELLALAWWVLHHPVAYNRAGVVFEDLYRAEKGSPARYGRLARAAAAYFRASRYRRCAELAAELPDDRALTAEARGWFPPGTTPADVRELGAVTAEAAALPRDGAGPQALRRMLLLKGSVYRLEYLVRAPESRRELDTAEARRWWDALAGQLRHEGAAVAGCDSPLLGGFLRREVAGLGRDLDGLRRELER